MASNPVALGVVALMRQSHQRSPQPRLRSRRWLRRQSMGSTPTTAPSSTSRPEVSPVRSRPSVTSKIAGVTPSATADPAG